MAPIHPRRGSRRSSRRSSATLLALVMTLSLAACGADEAPATDTTDTTASAVVALAAADVGEARLDTIAGGVLLSGPLEPARRVMLKAQVDGTISSLLVDRGSPVREGQLLLTIAADGVREQAASTESAIAAAKAGVAVAEQRRDGARALYAKGAIAEVDLRAAEAQYEASRAELIAVQAGAASAREMASRTRVTSPISGTISDRRVQAGEPVQNGGLMLTVVDTRTLDSRVVWVSTSLRSWRRVCRWSSAYQRDRNKPFVVALCALTRKRIPRRVRLVCTSSSRTPIGS